MTVQAATQPPPILAPQPWQALQPGAPFQPHHGSPCTPRDQVLCDLVYLFNNVVRCYAPAQGHHIPHHPSLLTHHNGQLVLAQPGGAMPGKELQASASQVSSEYVASWHAIRVTDHTTLLVRGIRPEVKWVWGLQRGKRRGTCDSHLNNLTAFLRIFVHTQHKTTAQRTSDTAHRTYYT